MWRRNSLSLSSKLAYSNSSSSLLYLFRSSPKPASCHGLLARSNFSGPESTLATDPLKWSQSGALPTSASAIGFPRLAAASAFKANEVADLAKHYGRCYWELSKARLSMLVVATSGTGYILGSGGSIDYLGLCCTCAGTMMVAASANSLNQVFEVKNDAIMNRTRHRPLPSGRITIPHAVAWAASMGVGGTALLACKVNMLAAGLAASNLVLYAFVYTPLKQIHPVNTWVGAIVGAIPPLLGFKMFSLADSCGRRTALVSLRNCLYLLPLGYLAYDWGITSGWFFAESTALALAISWTATSFFRNRSIKNARRMFHASLLYLPVFMGGLVLHHLPEVTQGDGDDPSSSSSSFHPLKNTIPTRPPVAYASVAPFPFLPAPYITT